MPTREKKALRAAYRNYRVTGRLTALYAGYARDARLDGNRFSEDFWSAKLDELSPEYASTQLSLALQAHRESLYPKFRLKEDYTVPFTRLALVHIVDDSPFGHLGPTFIGATWNGLWNILSGYDEEGLAEQHPVHGMPDPVTAVDYSVQEFLRTFPGLSIQAIQF